MDTTMEKQQNQNRINKAVIALLIILLIAAIAVPASMYYGQKISARTALKTAKSVHLALNLVNLESYGLDSAIIDTSRKSGLTGTAEEEIRSLSSCDGDFYVFGWNMEEMYVKEFVYTEGNYIVHFTARDREDVSWDVSRIRKILSYE